MDSKEKTTKQDMTSVQNQINESKARAMKRIAEIKNRRMMAMILGLKGQSSKKKSQ